MASPDNGHTPGNPKYYSYPAIPSPASRSGSAYGYSARPSPPSPRSPRHASREHPQYISVEGVIYYTPSPGEECSPIYGANGYFRHPTSSFPAGSPSDGRHNYPTKLLPPSHLGYQSRYTSSEDSYGYYTRGEYSPICKSSEYYAPTNTNEPEASRSESTSSNAAKLDSKNSLRYLRKRVPSQSLARQNPSRKKPKRNATYEDAKKHGIPPGYSLKNWDPTEESISLLKSVFDANSLGKWIYDWTVYHHGPGIPMTEMAGDLWLNFIQLSAKIQRAEGRGEEEIATKKLPASMAQTVSSILRKPQLFDDCNFQTDRTNLLYEFKVHHNPRKRQPANSGSLGNKGCISNITHLIPEDQDIAPTECLVEDQQSDEEMTCSNIDPKFLGRANLTAWKRGVGRAKDWRQQCYVKIVSHRQRFNRRRSIKRVDILCEAHTSYPPTHMKFNSQWTPTAIPAVLYKRHPRLDSEAEVIRASASVLSRTNQKFPKKYPKTTVFNDMPVVKASRPPEKDRFALEPPSHQDDVPLVQELVTQNAPTQQINETSQTIILNYPGEVLPFSYRILYHLRSETHHEVYTGDSLANDQKYEIRVYTISGIPPNQRKRRVENLKKTTAIPSFVTSFDWKGKKYAIFSPRDDRNETGTKKLKLGAIGRKNTQEHDEAFPKIPSCPRDSELQQAVEIGFADKISPKYRWLAFTSKSKPSTEAQDYRSAEIGLQGKLASSSRHNDPSLHRGGMPAQKKSRRRHRKKRTLVGKLVGKESIVKSVTVDILPSGTILDSVHSHPLSLRKSMSWAEKRFQDIELYWKFR